MRQLTSLEADFLHVESPTTVAHVGTLILVDPATADGGGWGLESVWSLLEPRLHLAGPLRQRLVEVPLGIGRPYWADDPHFDIEFHLRELALPAPGTPEQLAEQVARIHARPLDRTRPLWEGYVITGLEDGRAAYYSKIHHAALDGRSRAEVLETILDLTPEPRDVEPEEFSPGRLPSTLEMVGRGLASAVLDPVELLRTLPRSLGHLDELPGVSGLPGARLVTSTAELVTSSLYPRRHVDRRALSAPRTPLNGRITPHRRFAFGSVSMEEVNLVKNHYGLTVDDVVMTMTAAALRRWLLDHDALPTSPVVAAVPVSVRAEEPAFHGDHVSVTTAELPTHVPDPLQRLQFMQASMQEAQQRFEAMPATLLENVPRGVPTALSGLAARALFRLAATPDVPFNLFVSNVPGPPAPLFLAGARVEGIYPVSAVSDLSGGLDISLFSYDGDLDIGLIACREMVPDVWNVAGYLQEALAELVDLPRR